MYKCILVPLDGSKRAEAILPHVEQIASLFKAKVIFLHVVEPPPIVTDEGGPYLENFQNQLQTMTEQVGLYLKGIAGEFREKGIDATEQIGYGPVAEGILKTAQREQADLIAIASHGRTGLSRVFYGSVALGLLHAADRPLLVIRSD